MAKPRIYKALSPTKNPFIGRYGAAWDRFMLRILRLSLSVGGRLWGRRIFSALSYLGVFQKSYDERFSFPNGLWFEWGFDHKDMDYDGWAQTMHPDDQDYVMAELDRQLRSGDYVELPEYRIITKQGDTKWVLSKGVVVERNSEGVVTHYLGADFDVTPQKETEAKVDRLLSERTAILKESRHRIKNQIRAIDVHIARIMEQPTVSPEDLASIRLQLRSIQNVNRALTEAPVSRRVDVGALINNVVDDVRFLFDPEESVRVSSELKRVRGPSSVALILAVGVQEALTNAFRHTPHVGTQEWIRIQLTTDYGEVQLLVANGAPAFGATTTEVESHAPSGEGLTFLKEMVENERGSFAAGYDDHTGEWVVVIRIPITAP